MSEAEVVGEKRKASPVSEEEHRLQQYSDEVQAQLNELELEKKSILDGMVPVVAVPGYNSG